eukprot:c5613_g1_i1.p1 GENE.c5613_g1_i1~~c5613_g1_i1.p1  ORF type:complete len:316 (-),score=83.87 c5613_g1_i1:212-1111(-)
MLARALRMTVSRGCSRTPTTTTLSKCSFYSTKGGLVNLQFAGDSARARVAVIEFNNPSKLNAMTEELGKHFENVIHALKQDPGVRAVVITGAGRAFSAGGDMDFLWARVHNKHNFEENKQKMLEFYNHFLCMRSLPVPIIAAINGPAIGAGMAIAVASDYRIASSSAKMGFTFSRLGLFPGMGSTHFLPRLCGSSAAFRLLAGGETFGPQQALSMGFVDEVCGDGEEPRARAIQLAHSIASEASPAVVKAIVGRIFRPHPDPELQKALELEAEAQAHSYASKELVEGLTALTEKRSPVF